MKDKIYSQEQWKNTKVNAVFPDVNILSDIHQIVSFDQEYIFSSKEDLFGLIEDDSSYKRMGYLPRYIISELVDNMRNHWFFDGKRSSSICWVIKDNILYIKTVNYMTEAINHGWVINSLDGFINYLQMINTSDLNVLNALYIKRQQQGLNGHTIDLLNDNSWAWLGFLDIGRKIKEKNISWNVFEHRFSSETAANESWKHIVKFELLTKVPVTLPNSI